MSAKSHPYKHVVLGFVEPATEDTAVPTNFASKAGGRPVWLYREPRPPPQVTRCSNCLQPDRFLLQVYAPIEEDVVGHSQAFHRTLYVSVCRNSACLSGCKGVSVIRAQLPRCNPFYPFNADDGAFGGCCDEDANNAHAHSSALACDLCGYKGDLICSGCHRVRYCSKRCQKDDWACGHRAQCSKTSKSDSNQMEETPTTKTSVYPIEQKRDLWRFPEMEIVTDKHCTPPHSESDEDDDGDDEAKDQPKQEASCGSTKPNGATPDTARKNIAKGIFQDADEEELPEDLFVGRNATRASDNVAEKFACVVGYEPEQVIRYERSGHPLWGCRDGQVASKDVEVCENCGSHRVFELQIMPQLPYLLDRHKRESGTHENFDGSDGTNLGLEGIARRLRDDADWLTIVIMTCAKSCALEEGGYAKEYAWVQRTP